MSLLREIIFNNEFCCRHKKRVVDFTRDRKFSFPELILFQMNMSTKSLSIDLTNFFSWFSSISELNIGTKQSYSDARLKFLYTAYLELHERLIKSFYGDNICKRYKGYRLIAIDGSRLQLPNTQSIIEEFGIAENKGRTIPMAMTSVAYDVLNDMAVNSFIDRYEASERTLADKHLVRIKELLPAGKDIILLDRGYPSLYLMAKMHALGQDFVIRCNESNFLREVKTFALGALHDQIIVVDLTSGDRKYKSDLQQIVQEYSITSLRLRVVKIFLSSGKVELLITSLCNRITWGRTALGTLYNLRWNEETYFNFQKNILEIENFSGKSPEAVRQDYYSRVLVANIHSLLIQEAQDEIDEETASSTDRQYARYTINKSVATGIIKNRIIAMLFTPCDEWEDKYQTIVAMIKKQIIATVPGRHNARNHKRTYNWYLKKRKSL